MKKPNKTDVYKIISSISGKKIEELNPDLLLRSDLNIDSIGAMDIRFELEEQFSIIIPYEDSYAFKKIQDILTYLEITE